MISESFKYQPVPEIILKEFRRHIEREALNRLTALHEGRKTTVPVVYDGLFNKMIMDGLKESDIYGQTHTK